MSTEFNLSFVQGLTVREKAELVTGKDFWFTAENIENDIPKIMVTAVSYTHLTLPTICSV